MVKLHTMKVLSLALAAIMVFSVNARADVIGTGDGGIIPDLFNNNIVPLESVITFDVDEEIVDVTVTLHNLIHMWSGDLIVWLEGPDGTTVDLVNRLGRIDTGPGRSDEYNGDYAFNDAFVGDLWATSGDPVPAGDYFPTTASGVTVSLLDAFEGKSTAGDWMLSITDNAVNFEGTLGTSPTFENGWTLEFQSIPEPSTWALFVIGSLFVVAVHRRQRRKTA